MSVQNLLKENNYSLYLNAAELNATNLSVDNLTSANATIDNLTATDIDAENINVTQGLASSSLTCTDIFVNSIASIAPIQKIDIVNDLIPSQPAFPSLGNSNDPFKDLFAVNHYGYSTANPFNAPTGMIIGDNTNNPLSIYNYFTGNFTLQGCWTGLANFGASYYAVVVGNSVTMTINIFSTQAPPSTTPPSALNNQPIILGGLNPILSPTANKVVALLVNVNNTRGSGAIVIGSNSLTIFSSWDLNAGFINGNEASYAYPNGTQYSFSYTLS